MATDIKVLEKQFHADGYRLGMHAAENIFNKKQLYEGVGSMYEMVDQVVEAFTAYAEEHAAKLDCRKGCSWCCYQPVFANSYELQLVNENVNENFHKEERLEVLNKANAKYAVTKSLDGEALLHSKFPCPLLRDGSCSVYSVRPVACRIYLSTDVGTCRKFYSHPADPDSVPALSELPMRLGRMINEGFGAALKANGVQVKEVRIEEGLVQLNAQNP